MLEMKFYNYFYSLNETNLMYFWGSYATMPIYSSKTVEARSK